MFFVVKHLPDRAWKCPQALGENGEPFGGWRWWGLSKHHTKKIKKKQTRKIWKNRLKGSKLRSKWHTVLPPSHIPSVSALAQTHRRTHRHTHAQKKSRAVSLKQKHLWDADKRRLFPKKDLSKSTNNFWLKWNPWHFYPLNSGHDDDTSVLCNHLSFFYWFKK